MPSYYLERSHIGSTPYNAESFLSKSWRLMEFFQFEIIINVLLSCFRFICIHYAMILTSKDGSRAAEMVKIVFVFAMTG